MNISAYLSTKGFVASVAGAGKLKISSHDDDNRIYPKSGGNYVLDYEIYFRHTTNR
jgi:hypothetical protein